MDATQIIISAIVSIFGAGGLMVTFLELKFRKEKTSAEQGKQQRHMQNMLMDEYFHASARVMFWIVRGLMQMERDTKTRYWNGDLEKAYLVLQQTEEKKDELDRKLLSKEH